MELEDRFMDKVYEEPNSGCWLWGGARDRGGYGVLRVEAHTARAHRVAYILHVGEISAGMCVCHICDNPSCVNPDHLFLGTHQDNMADKKRKRRNPEGARHHRAKLTTDEVKEIREATGCTQKELGERFGVSQQQVSKIRSGKQRTFK